MLGNTAAGVKIPDYHVRMDAKLFKSLISAVSGYYKIVIIKGKRPAGIFSGTEYITGHRINSIL